MTTPKRLYDVLPIDKQVVPLVGLNNLVGQPLTVNKCAIVTNGNKVHADMTVTVSSTNAHVRVMAAQEQIIDVCRFLVEGEHLPVLAMFITLGKSYAMVNPPDEPQSADDPAEVKE